MSEDLLGYVIEFSIGLAGFSGVVAVFSGRSHSRIQLELFRLRNLLFGSLIPAVLCFVALGIHRAVPSESLAWKLSLSVSIVFLGGFVAHAIWSRYSMPEEQQQLLQPTAFLIAAAALVVAILVQLGAIAGLLDVDQFDVFYLGLMVILLIAMYQFVRAVLDGVRLNATNQAEKEDSHRDA